MSGTGVLTVRPGVAARVRQLQAGEEIAVGVGAERVWRCAATSVSRSAAIADCVAGVSTS